MTFWCWDGAKPSLSLEDTRRGVREEKVLPQGWSGTFIIDFRGF